MTAKHETHGQEKGPLLLDPEFITALSSLMEIPTVISPAESAMPFGKAIHTGMMQFLQIAEAWGFRTFMAPEGYYCYCEAGEGASLFAVLGHIDVVPEGDLSQWEVAPYRLTLKDGFLYGRGILDDKGPLLAALFSFYKLLQEGFKPNQRVRFILGGDEENHWRCVSAYKAKEEIPQMGFTPDASFPVIYGEKGILEYRLVAKLQLDYLFSGGEAINAVPAFAITGFTQELAEVCLAEGISFREEEGKLIILGKSVHAMRAEEGDNAILKLAALLKNQGHAHPIIDFLLDCCDSPYGEGLVGALVGEIGDKPRINPGKVSFSSNMQYMDLDIRIPISIDIDAVEARLRSCFEAYGLEATLLDKLPAINLSCQSRIIQALTAAYVDVTGNKEEVPRTSGGATYARAFPNMVAFGAAFPQTASTEHQPNERFAVTELAMAIKIYRRAYELLLT